MNKQIIVPCEIWTRVVGYFRTHKDMNPGKRTEVNERTMFKIPNLDEVRNGTKNSTTC
jgi:hypothetical protein